jgi:hypothetical protein
MYEVTAAEIPVKTFAKIATLAKAMLPKILVNSKVGNKRVQLKFLINIEIISNTVTKITHQQPTFQSANYTAQNITPSYQ